MTRCMMTSSQHSLRASSGDWWVDIIRISTNEKTLRSSHQYHHYRWYCPKNIQLNILYCHCFFLMTIPCNGLPRYKNAQVANTILLSWAPSRSVACRDSNVTNVERKGTWTIQWLQRVSVHLLLVVRYVLLATVWHGYTCVSREWATWVSI